MRYGVVASSLVVGIGVFLACAVRQPVRADSDIAAAGELPSAGTTSVIPAGSPASANPVASPPAPSASPSESVLKGSASFRVASPASKDYDIGMRALDARLYKEAEQRLAKASIELRKTRNLERPRVLAKLGLAEAYLAQGMTMRARTTLSELRADCFSIFGAESPEVARYHLELGEELLQEGKLEHALQSAEECLRILTKNGSALDVAISNVLIGRIQLKQTYFDEARKSFRKALATLELEPGRDRLEYAYALSGLAMAEKNAGHEDESAAVMKKAIAIKDDAVELDKTQDQKGLVTYEWIDGMPGSRQIADPLYPFKYMVIDGLRVAVAVVRSQKHMGVLISIANCSKKTLAVAVGKVELEVVNPGRKFMYYCDPNYIDTVLEEDVVLGLTWRRHWLEHIQKSRKIPGYLKNSILDPDDFYGNNVFGTYGAWDSALRDAPPIVTREQFFYDENKPPPDTDMLTFMRGSSSSIRPTIIEPGSARTGLVMFLRERYDDAIVRMHLGNALIEFPFHVPAGIGGYPRAN